MLSHREFVSGLVSVQSLMSSNFVSDDPVPTDLNGAKNDSPESKGGKRGRSRTIYGEN